MYFEPDNRDRATALILLFWCGLLLAVVGYLYFIVNVL